MRINAPRRIFRYLLVLSVLFLTGCGRAPAFDIVGSFFPAWMVCFAVATVLTVISRALLNRYVEILWPVLIYPSLAAIFSCALWLVLFR